MRGLVYDTVCYIDRPTNAWCVVIEQAALGNAIETVYEAAVQPGLWRQALHELALASDALGAQMLHHRPTGAALHTVSEGLDEVSAAFFREGWHIDNPRELRARQRRMGLQEVITDATLFTPEELDREPWQTEFLDRFGLRWFSSFNAILFDEVSPVILTLERPRSSDPFSAHEVEQLGGIVAHVQRACRLSLAVADAAAGGMLESLDRLGRGALLLDDLGRVVRLNASAAGQLGAGLGLSAGRLRADTRDADRRLQALLANVTAAEAARGGPAPDGLSIPRDARRPLVVTAAPLVNSARDLFQQARAIVLLRDLDRRAEPDSALLRATFELTAAEARLAQAVAGGRRPDAAAGLLGIGRETARSHLKMVFAKTGTRSQSELAVLLDRLAGP